jgi:hypothetical protein
VRTRGFCGVADGIARPPPHHHVSDQVSADTQMSDTMSHCAVVLSWWYNAATFDRQCPWVNVVVVGRAAKP